MEAAEADLADSMLAQLALTAFVQVSDIGPENAVGMLPSMCRGLRLPPTTIIAQLSSDGQADHRTMIGREPVLEATERTAQRGGRRPKCGL